MFQIVNYPFQEILEVLVYWDKILSGFILTMWIYGCAIFMGFLLGLVLAISRQYGGRILSGISILYIEIIRGTPLLVQVLFLYFLPSSLNLPAGRWRVSTEFVIFDKTIVLILLDQRTLSGILALGLNSAAYQAEYFRSSIISVGTGQMLAAQSIGMSRVSGIRNIVLPQALRRVIPAWSNEAAYLPKYTVLVYFIGVREIFSEAHWIVSKTFHALPTYIIIALIFIVAIWIISKSLDVLHKKTKIPGL